jgi:hypothetical protein
LTISPKGREWRGWGSHPICLIPTATDFPRSQLSRLGKALRSRRDRYIEGFRIPEILIEDSKSRERNAWQLRPWDMGTMGRTHLPVRNRWAKQRSESRLEDKGRNLLTSPNSSD